MGKFALTLAMAWMALAPTLASAIEAVQANIYVYRRGENLGGEEFIAANEQIADYIATLPRPTEIFKFYKYSCLVKFRTIQPTVNQTGGQTPTFTSYVNIRMVYELKDCKKVN